MRKMDYSVSDEGDLLKLKWIGTYHQKAFQPTIPESHGWHPAIS